MCLKSFRQEKGMNLRGFSQAFRRLNPKKYFYQSSLADCPWPLYPANRERFCESLRITSGRRKHFPEPTPLPTVRHPFLPELLLRLEHPARAFNPRRPENSPSFGISHVFSPSSTCSRAPQSGPPALPAFALFRHEAYSPHLKSQTIYRSTSSYNLVENSVCLFKIIASIRNTFP